MTAPQTKATGLPTHVESRKIADAMSDRWNLIPLGVQENRYIVGVDLKDAAHTLLTGPCGTGKSAAMRHMMVAALARGFDVRLIDPACEGHDFTDMAPWMTSATTLDEALAVLLVLDREITRRSQVLQGLGLAKWEDLSTEMAGRAENRRIMVFFDEYTSTAMQHDVPRDLPLGVQFQFEDTNHAKAQITLVVGRLARTGRFAGIHLVVAVQRPSAVISGEMRSNLSNKIQFTAPGRAIAPEALRMVFPGATAVQAMNEHAALDDGKSRGLALMSTNEGDVTGYRQAFIGRDEAAAVLDDLGVPRKDA